VSQESRYAVPGGVNSPMDTEWMAEAKCREVPPSVFFPSDGVGVQAAQRICVDCPVAEACLEYALANRIDHGVWGGRSERARRRILRSRRVGSLSAAR
jgi:WhiB family redox-sensing transcriptional regulator